MGDVFPEIRKKQSHVVEVILVEEEAFNKTLDSGLQIFDQLVTLHAKVSELPKTVIPALDRLAKNLTQNDPTKIPFNTNGAEVVTVVNSVVKANSQLWQKVCTNPESLIISHAQKLPALLEDFYHFADQSGLDVRKKALLDSVFMLQASVNGVDRPAKSFWGSSACGTLAVVRAVSKDKVSPSAESSSERSPLCSSVPPCSSAC